MTSRNLIILALVAIAIVGCGRRGSLEAPGKPAAALSEAPPVPGSAPAADTASPGALEPPQAAPVVAPERRFILDPLI